MTHLSHETLWIAAMFLAAAVAYWRGSRSAKGCPNTQRLLQELDARTGSLVKTSQLFEEEIEVLHRRISWIRRDEAEVAAVSAEHELPEVAQ